MGSMQEFLRFFGHGFCHQIPARSLEAGGVVFSACARDTGIYLGFFFALVVAFIIYARVKGKPTELPPALYVVVLVLLVLPMAFDGVTSYLGLRPTTNMIRYLTGFLAGVAVGSVVVPLLFALRKDAVPGQRIFARPSMVAPHLALTFALGAVFFVTYPYLGLVAPLVPVGAFLTITVCVNLILLTLSRRFAPRHTAAHWLFLLALCLILALVEIALFGAIRDMVVQVLLNGHEFSEFLS
ncbi:MAG: DUF2085 domain-containing protein [Coriobacteriales bacterium]|jgi:uncharacterized membrane protein|nr:DUF2085 domain-containing protein [Coriobacteriales bacterium]